MPVIILWGAMILFFLGFLWLLSDFNFSIERYYLLPWCVLAAIVILSPSFYFLYKKKFDLFHPLVFGALTYVFPAFVFGGILLSFGWSEPFYLTFIEDPYYNLPLTLVYVMIGFISIIAGYSLPLGKIISTKMNSWLPTWEWDPSDVWVPGIFLVVAGVIFNIIGFIQGLVGFQRVDEVGIFDGLLFFLIILLTEGSLLLWLAIFSNKYKTGIYYIVLAGLIAVIPVKMALQGNRGSLVGSALIIVFAFQFSGRKLKLKNTVIIGAILVVSIFIGMIYGTAFRNIKGSESRANTDSYIVQVAATIDYLLVKDTGKILAEGMQNMAERIDNLSAMGVVVANHEHLKPYEAGFGLEDNIVNDLYTSFIPRFIWEDKPNTSDARAYSDLYFNFSENSFAITPFGDLLRNFGPIGVPLGMLIIGIYFRAIYDLLINTDKPLLWKKVSYFVLLTLFSFESFYATFFPTLVRTVIVLVISLYLANIIVKLVRGSTNNPRF